MSWLWGKKDKDVTEEKLVEEGKDLIDEGLQHSSFESEVGYGDNDESINDDKGISTETIQNDDQNQVEDGVNGYDDVKSSDESSLEITSDDGCSYDDDDDDDSIVVNLIESMSTEDEVSDDDISIIEVTNDASQNPDDDAKYKASPTEGQEISTAKSKFDSAKEEQSDVDDAGNDDPVTSFWEKQSLLVLAAEHDRVDILKALLKDENEEKETLLNSGIPPLHLAISFGSVNTAQTLLRMGADPSVRPNIDVVLEERRNQPEDSKVDIPNIRRFEMITAWELAFGNSLYEDKSKKTSGAWSLFGSTTPAESNITAAPSATETSINRIIKPVDMPPSKREGIRHAFTAEALRSVGSDEVERLKQLVCSGMPATIDIGGNDLYGWAVEMGALQCEEFLRPVEAAKYEEKVNVDTSTTDSIVSSGEGRSVTISNDNLNKLSTEDHEEEKTSSSFVVHRPDSEETIPQLKNRLDELDSLSMALSTCLDNLAEEVSVCHGLLLMGGGASALASHVRSLRALKAQKFSEIEDVRFECEDAERELIDLVHSTGDIGKEIAEIASSNFLDGHFDRRALSPSNESDEHFNASTVENEKRQHDNNVEDQLRGKGSEVEKLEIKAQIAASENKIRKLRASIADLSEENSRDLEEVERRGLEGGINLVRGLREEIRDLEFHLSEARSMKTACKAKIRMILARVPKLENKIPSTKDNSDAATVKVNPEIENADRPENNVSNNLSGLKKSANFACDRDLDKDETSKEKAINPSEIQELRRKEIISQPDTKLSDAKPSPLPRHENSQGDNIVTDQGSVSKISASARIANGDSRAIAIIQPGNKGFFTVDLWEVLLRIIGYESAANRRSIKNATKTTSKVQPNVMTI